MGGDTYALLEIFDGRWGEDTASCVGLGCLQTSMRIPNREERRWGILFPKSLRDVYSQSLAKNLQHSSGLVTVGSRRGSCMVYSPV